MRSFTTIKHIFTVLAREHALFHLTLKTHYEDTFRRHVAPHCLAPHCLVTPHFPVTPHFGAALFGATLFGDATFSCGATFWRRIVWRHIAWRRHIFLWRHILAPHCLAPHCLVTPHFPVTPHFGATFFGDTLFGDATLRGVTLHRWAWSWLAWFRLGVGSVGKNAPGTGCIFGSMVWLTFAGQVSLDELHDTFWCCGERSAKPQIQNAVYGLKLSFLGRCCIASLYFLYSHCIFIMVSLFC